MSGGSFDYKYSVFDEYYIGRTHDEKLDNMLKDLSEVLHDLEWAEDGDISFKDYKETLNNFKKKWWNQKHISEDKLQVYVDGSFLNGMYGGAFVVFEDGNIIHQDNGIGKDNKELLSMRNISGELMASMRATDWLYRNNRKGILIHDYTGISKWVIGEWQANKEYTQKYVKYMKPFYEKGIIDFKWVKGHQGIEGNEIADKLSIEAIRYKKQWDNV